MLRRHHGTQTTNLNGSTKQHFPFMKFPPELRLLIYEFALEDLIPTMAHPTPSRPAAIYRFSSPYVSAMQLRARGILALLLTSKEVRAESSKAVLPSMLVHLQNYRSRTWLDGEEWVQFLLRVNNNQTDFGSETVRREFGELENQLNCASFDCKVVFSVHAAMSRAATGSLP